MIGIATSDLHLGHARYPATVDGRNVRARDVEAAWGHVIDHVVEQQPDLLSIAGDCFDNRRPSMHAIKAFQAGILRVLRETNAHIVILVGNHEGMRTVDALSPVIVVDDLDSRVHVVEEPARITFSTGVLGNAYRERVSLDCFPFSTLGAQQVWQVEPDATADVTGLLIHAAVRSSRMDVPFPIGYGGPESFDVGEAAERYSFVAAGDFHDFRRLHPDRIAFYSGAIERVSSNPWDEWEKCVVRFDTANQSMETLEIPGRAMHVWDLGDFDLPPGVGADDLNGVLRRLCDNARLDKSITRLVVDAFPREERDRIDYALVRQLKAKCTHFQLDLKYAEASVVDLGDRRSRIARSLDEAAAEFMADDPDDVRTCALSFLEEAA